MGSRANRRDFFQLTGGLAASFLAPHWLSGVTMAAAAGDSANDRIRWGAIGTGDRWGSMRNNEEVAGVGGAAMRYGDFLAVCDVDRYRCERAAFLTGGRADRFEDYQKVLERSDIDAVTIVTTDHWHVKIAVEAMRAGKDVYCEKPLTLTIDEGKLICKTARETKRVFQVGTQQRSEFGRRFIDAVALCRAGRLGEIKKVTCAIGSGPSSDALPKVDPPNSLNWDKWLGPAPWADFRFKGNFPIQGQSRCHYEFRWWYEYSGGKLTDWGAHHIDIAQWALGLDDTGPVSIEPISVDFPVPMEKGYPTRDDAYNTPVKFNVLCRFANGVELTIRDEARDLGFGNGIMFEGTKGRILVNREKLTGAPVEALKDEPLPEELMRELYKGKTPGNHMGNFVECLRDRTDPISDVYSHHRTMTTCHLANIALRLGRTIQWDPANEDIVGDDEARTFLSRAPRKGYETEA
ncbi:MAG: Gfo/Idh/MocA family oxidoreductase [Planctomycetales bacterium]|nr:Gfo/Idh/MocA family oxidoreductase [Planctomycetales bacterium]